MNQSLESDDELVARIQKDGNQQAFRQLVIRHNSRLLGRFIKAVNNKTDAEDLCQQLWMKVAAGLRDYEPKGIFENFLSVIATNLIHDHRKDSGRRKSHFVDTDTHPASSEIAKESDLVIREAVDQLISDYIPRLSAELRTAFLLNHESEFWQPQHRLSWEDLATLNGIDIDRAWGYFDRFRVSIHSRQIKKLVDTEESCVFFVWTESQRPGKHIRNTQEHFSKMLGIKPETFRTRYRTALKRLMEMHKEDGNWNNTDESKR